MGLPKINLTPHNNSLTSAEIPKITFNSPLNMPDSNTGDLRYKVRLANMSGGFRGGSIDPSTSFFPRPKLNL